MLNFPVCATRLENRQLRFHTAPSVASWFDERSQFQFNQAGFPPSYYSLTGDRLASPMCYLLLSLTRAEAERQRSNSMLNAQLKLSKLCPPYAYDPCKRGSSSLPFSSYKSDHFSIQSSSHPRFTSDKLTSLNQLYRTKCNMSLLRISSALLFLLVLLAAPHSTPEAAPTRSMEDQRRNYRTGLIIAKLYVKVR